MPLRLYWPGVVLATWLAGPVAAQVKIGMSFWDQKESVNALAFAPSGKTLVTAGGNLSSNHVAFWDLEKMTCSTVITDTGMGTALVMSPDGNTLVVQTIRHLGGHVTVAAIQVYDIPGGKKRFDVENGETRTRMAISPDGKLLALGNKNGSVSLCDLQTGKESVTLAGGNEPVWAMAFSPDGQHLAAISNEAGLVRQWNVPRRTAVPSLKCGSESLRALSYSPDGKTLIIGTGTDLDQPGELILWDIATNKELKRWPEHAGPVVGVQFDRQGKFLASGARSSDIILWDWATGKKLAELDGPLNLSSLAFSPDGNMLAVAGGTGDFIISIGGVRLWEMPSGRERLAPKAAAARDRREALLAQTAKDQAAAKAARQEQLPTVTAESLRRAEYALKIHQAHDHIRRWEFVQARSLLDELRPAPGQVDLRGLDWHWLEAAMPRTLDLGASEEVTAARLSSDGKMLAVANRRQVQLVDPTSGKTLWVLDGFRHWPGRLAFSPDGTLLAVADYTPNADQSEVKIFQVATGKLVATFSEHRSGVESLAFASDGSLLVAAGRSNLITIWEIRTRKLVRSFQQEWIVGTAVLSPDLKLVASGTIFQSLQVRELATGRELFQPGAEHRGLGSEGLLFLPDGKHLIAEGDRQVVMVEAATGRIVRPIKSATGRRDGAEQFSTDRRASLVLSPDDRKLIVGWSLIDLAADEALATFEQGDHGDRIPRREDYLHCVAVTPDERVAMVICSKKRAKLVSFPFVLKPRVLSIGAGHLSHVGYSDDGTTLLASTYRWIERKTPNGSILEGPTNFVEKWEGRTGASRFRAQPTDTKSISLTFDREKGPTIEAGRASLTLTELAASRAYITLSGSNKSAVVLGYSATNHFLALKFEERLVLVDARTGTPLPNWSPRPSGESFLRFIGEGKQAVSLDRGDLVLWDTQTGETLKCWTVPGSMHAMRLSADGQEPASVVLREPKGDRRFLLWDLKTGEAVGILRGHGKIEAAAFSPDGQTLATISSDGTILLWDAVTGHARGALGTNLKASLTQLVFQADGRGLAVGDFDGTIRLWTAP